MNPVRKPTTYPGTPEIVLLLAPGRPINLLEVVALVQDKLISELDNLIRGTDDPRQVLRRLAQEHGPEETAQLARIVFGSWRSRIDLVEDTLNEIVAE